MKTDSPHRPTGSRSVRIVVALLLAGLLVGVATAVGTTRHRKPMPEATKVRLAKAHRAARIGCRRVAHNRPAIKRRCGRIAKPAKTSTDARTPTTSTAVKRTSSVAAGYAQFGFVCSFDGGWHAQLLTSPNDFADGSRDFLLWMQFPPGLDLLPGGTLVMTVFASVYCDVYGHIAFPTPVTQTPPPVQPDVPTFADSCGTSGDRFRIPDAVPVPLFTLFGPDETTVNLTDPDVGMMYLVDGRITPPGTYAAPTGGSRTVTIDAVPTTDRYTVRTPRRWVFTFDSTPCPTPVSPVKPSVTSVVCGPNNDVIGRLESIEGLQYDYGSWSNNRRTVTATARSGYVIPGEPDGVVSWTFIDEDTPCPITVSTRAPSVREMCGPTNDVITVPVIEGVAYTVGEWQEDGTLSVTAAARPGYVIAAGAGIAWKITDIDRECPRVDPPTPATTLRIRMVGKRLRRTDQNVVYGLYIRNVGTTTARNVVIRDPIPAGLVVKRRPVEGRIRKGTIVWRIGDLQPGSWIYLNATMRAARNRAMVRCNIATAKATNAAVVRARRCTRFIQVAGVSYSGVTG